MNAGKMSNTIRLAIVAVVIISGAYWAGGRWGQRQPQRVQALPLGSTPADVAARDAGLTDDESINVRVYRDVAPAVANVLTKATEYDFFMDRSEEHTSELQSHVNLVC